MDIVTFNKLSKSFGKTLALSNVDFTIKEGEIFGYLGPNGAGKTTTISCMLDLIRADSGDIQINGFDSHKDTLKIKEITGFVPSDHYFFPNWTGNDHMDYIESIKGRTLLKTKLINDFDYNPRLKIRDLSTGNRQKLALIIAMMHAPKLLILDEPTRGLDPLLQNVFYNYLRVLQDKGTTTFMSSHNLTEIENICSRVAIIKKGSIVEIADVTNLQGKSVYLMAITFANIPKLDKAELKRQNIEINKHIDKHYEFKVSGNINKALQILSKHPIKDIKINKASLEDIFLELYK